MAPGATNLQAQNANQSMTFTLTTLTGLFPTGTFTQWVQFRIKHCYTRYRCEGYNNITSYPLTPYCATYWDERGGTVNPSVGAFTTPAAYTMMPYGKRRPLQGGFRWCPKVLTYIDVGNDAAGGNNVTFTRTEPWLFCDTFGSGGGPAGANVLFAGPALLMPGMQQYGVPITNAQLTAGYGIPTWKWDTCVVVEFRGYRGPNTGASLATMVSTPFHEDHSIREELENNIYTGVVNTIFGKTNVVKKDLHDTEALK